jgi:hypothetical protein
VSNGDDRTSWKNASLDGDGGRYRASVELSGDWSRHAHHADIIGDLWLPGVCSVCPGVCAELHLTSQILVNRTIDWNSQLEPGL